MRESLGRAFPVAAFLVVIATACGPVAGQTTLVPASYFHTISPCRLYDSRAGDGAFEPGEQRELQVATACGIPAEATAVALNLTGVSPTSTGNLLLFPNPLLPTLSNALSFKAGVTRAASGIYPLSDDGLGTLSVLANLTSGGVDLLVDVSGYFLPDSGTASHSPGPPVCQHGPSVRAVDCWEGGLLLSGSANQGFYLQAFREVRIRIDFRQNGTLKHSTYAYWDGRLAFTFRTSFPFKGSWTWTAVCEVCFGRTASPSGGNITVTNRRTDPLLYSRGFLSVDPSGRFLQHQTGMKFFWLGDTAWAAPMRTYKVSNSASTWSTYLTNRTATPNGVTPPPSAPTAGKYSIAQVSLAFHLGAGGYSACTGGECLDAAQRAAFTTPAQQGLAPVPRAARKVPGPTSYWTPAYWRNLDRRVYEANEKGMVVVLTGVMDLFGDPNSIANIPELKIFARNLAARMAGFFVIYSVGWDNRAEAATFACGSNSNPSSVVNGFTADASLVAKMKTVGAELSSAAPNHLITTHLGGGTPFFGADSYYHDPGASGQNTPLASPYSYFHREPWLDFHLFQSSQCNPDRASVFQHQGTGVPGSACQGFVAEEQLSCIMRRARTMPAKFLSLRSDDTLPLDPPLVKPAINGEARYEKTVLTGQPEVPDIAYQCRHAGHVTTGSGAAGYTGGVINVEEWRWPGDGMGLTGPRAGKCPEQLKYLSVLQEGQVMEWERLRRKEAMLRNPGTNENERSVVAASESNQAIVAYLPERAVSSQQNLQLAINQSKYVGFDSCRWSKAWWNPINGQQSGVEAAQIVRLPRTCEGTEPAPCFTFQFDAPKCTGINARPSDRCDWVLYLRDLGGCAGAAVPARVWSGLGEAASQWGVFSQPSDPSGEPSGPATPVSDSTSSVQASPKIAAGDQGALVVWVGEDGDGEGYAVLARKLDEVGRPLGTVLRVSDAAQGDQTSPSVAALGGTGYVVSWTLYSEESTLGEVYAQYLDAEGLPQSPRFLVNRTTAGQQGYSQVAADAGGNVLIAWESWGQDGDGNGVFARRFDSHHVGSDEFQVYQSGAGWQYLAGVGTEPNGGFSVTWQAFASNGHDLGTWGQRINVVGPPRSGSEYALAEPKGGDWE